MATWWIILAQFVCVQLASGSTVNVAFAKPVYVSSRYQGRDPRLAVDGDTRAVDILPEAGYGVIKTAPHQSDAWWWVDLKTRVQGATVKIYFRTDYIIRRNGVRLFTSTTPFNTYPSGDLCYTVTGSPDGTDILNVVSVNCSGTWQYLMVYTDTDNSGQGTGPMLDFGEVEVLVCVIGTYGANCTKSCSSRQCSVTSTSCDRYTGGCPGGCQAGWTGTDCTQVCESGLYGLGCSLSCVDRHCRLLTTCHHETGRCNNGCKPGWNGTDCIQVCPAGTYGESCSQLCSDRHCVTPSNTCDHVTGTCSSGCQPGWNGTDCKLQCLTGTYGFNCVKSCSPRQCRTPSSVCDRETGVCPDGCKDGWTGEDCSTQCPEGTFGLGCLSCSIRHCQGESNCTEDGTCSGGCKDGWTLGNCTQACPSGSYGPGCGFACANCTGDDICDHVNGYCPGDCKAGWRGTQCKQRCPVEQYGINCMEKCGHCIGTCDVVDGHCPRGCEEGYTGVQCDLPLMGVDDSSSFGPYVIGAVIGAVVMLVVSGGVHLCLLRQGRLQWTKTPSPKDSTQPGEMTDIPRPHVISHGISELSQSGSSHTHNNDYAVLDTDNKSDNKDYDVIKSPYENV